LINFRFRKIDDISYKQLFGERPQEKADVNGTERRRSYFYSWQNTRETTLVAYLCNFQNIIFQELEKNRDIPAESPEQITLRSLE